MKINKKNPWHWVYLFIFTINILVGVGYLLLSRRQKNKGIVLYGHKLNGNLLAIYDYIDRNSSDYNLGDVHFLTMDPAYYNTLCSRGVRVYNGQKTKDMLKVCLSGCIVSDHGLHSLVFLKKYSKIKFVDVWHGIPFKGFDRDDFKVQRDYLAVFVSSESMKGHYINQYGFVEDKIVITGYARTDRLVNHDYDLAAIRERSGINGKQHDKVVMIAPTWSHNTHGGTDIPFNLGVDEFLEGLAVLGRSDRIHFIFRSHLNSAEISNVYQDVISIKSVNDYPETEELLYLSDVLVSDWSSIVFDYLVLGRPVIFINKQDPFPKGYTYGPEYRFGEIVNNYEELLVNIKQVCSAPENYIQKYSEKMKQVHNEVYGVYADGESSRRCVEWLMANQ